MKKKTIKPPQTFTMNHLFNQYSNGVVKYSGREFTAYENLPPTTARDPIDWNKFTQLALGGIPFMGRVTDAMIANID